ncbi:MAG: hypothetical protein K0R39_3873 [Symbiobacteriaceae bacterium]|jgi:hypothetical protein|nr:hypothetical protein [Symbiobacteriaceae bacterium]
MGVRIWALLLCLLVLLGGCAKPAPGGGAEAASPGASTPPAPSIPVVAQPRLTLDLPLGDGPDQPGQLPARVGGIAPRGPLALAVDGGSLYLIDAAKSRIIQYDLQGGLVMTIPAPWLDDQVADLAVSPLGLIVTLFGVQYTIGADGRLLAISQVTDQPMGAGNGLWSIGTDRAGNRYEQALADPSGMIARRVNGDGRQLASAPIWELGDIHDWYVSRDGGLYALSYQWGQGEIERARVYEVLPPWGISSGPGGMDPTPAPVVMGYPLPTQIRLTFADWAPVAVTAEADRWNVWQLLATAQPTDGPDSWADYPGFEIAATLPDGSTLSMEVRQNELRVGGKRYLIPFYQGLNAVVQHLRFSEASVQAALDEATSVRVALLDLPGVERELTAEERARMRQSLTGAIAVSSAAGPHPLEVPFPQYGIHLEGKDWKGTLLLRGARHVRAESGGSALHGGELSRQAAALLPVPELQISDVSYLYLTEKLEIGQGQDLTRWKNTVVRRLVDAHVISGHRPTNTAPFTLTFWVNGEKLVVQVDADGFTYRGKRYPGSGLTEMIYLQGVP